ncbi:MAG: cysteine--tRNA ligase [Candidatus Marinimicrobia bacterium]|nr:cysteine--tRNA ligase [Candidatus Neomarinimicrobiota bacterium]
MARLRLYNSLNNKKEEFLPIDPNHIRVYTCGPTVYNYAHIGNARPPIVSDILVRLLRYLYPRVTYVSNITDIDDKIINSAIEQDIPISELTKKYEKIYNDNLIELGVSPPDIQPRATDHIAEMIKQVEALIDNGHAYEAEGHVLYSVNTFSNYGSLSGRDKEEQIAGSRVEVAPYKNDPADFILWKPSNEDQPGWSSPWGFGRPGWHLECSAMSEKTLGVPFDIHSGGQDLIFPHHENEIAQCCGVHKKTNDTASYARYWIHNGMLKFDGDKMSKSLGNVRFINDLINDHKGETLRMVLLSTHYRQPLNWSSKTIEQAQKNLDRLYRSIRKVDASLDRNQVEPSKYIVDALCDDLNTPEALGQLNILVNSLQDANEDQKVGIMSIVYSSARILGLLQHAPDDWLGYSKASDGLDLDLIERLIEKRNNCRSERNFKRADEIRDELKSIGIDIEDTPDGTIWRSEN